jgi:hypothetical protein
MPWKQVSSGVEFASCDPLLLTPSGYGSLPRPIVHHIKSSYQIILETACWGLGIGFEINGFKD